MISCPLDSSTRRESPKLLTTTLMSPRVHEMRWPSAGITAAAIVLLSGCAARGALRPVTQDVLEQTSGSTCTQTFHDSDERIKTKAQDFSITDAEGNTFL